MTAVRQKNRRTVLLLSVLVLGMFGFGFAMVPLYNLLCQVTGVQSVALRMDRSQAQLAPAVDTIDRSRTITVKFDATVNPSLPWEFQPPPGSLQLHPGELHTVSYQAHNRSNRTITGQAIPSVVPWQATSYLKKIECFCFTSQTLAGGDSVEMPLRFSISPHLPEGINSITLSYIFMRPDSDSAAPEVKTVQAHDHNNHPHGEG